MLLVLQGLLLFGALTPVCSQAANLSTTYPVVHRFFPQAERFGDIQGTPPAAPVYKGDKVIGYIFRTKEVAPLPAYSGKPVDILVGVDVSGKITGTKVIEQHEPILLVGIPVKRLYDFVAQYVGKQVTDTVEVGESAGQKKLVHVDGISGATVTATVVNHTIMKAARIVALAHNIITAEQARVHPMATVRKDVFKKESWNALIRDSSIGHLHLTMAQVQKAFGDSNNQEFNSSPSGKDDEPFADIYFGYLNVPTIGRNLLGKDRFKRLVSDLKPGEHAIAVFGNGYSFKGTGYVRGGIFDRLHVVQHGQTILFHDSDYNRLVDVSCQGFPGFTEMGIFTIRKANDFNPGDPWQIQLLVRRQTGPVSSVFRSFDARYQIPSRYLKIPVVQKQDEQPVWIGIWNKRRIDIVVLIISLVVLSMILFLQDWLVRKPRLLKYLRNGFLVYTVLFIGWHALGQLSVVNILTFVNAVLHNFQWNMFLMDPMLFLLWTFVAISLLLWGRGIFCGWLCPYGAAQELLNKIGRRLNAPQLEFPRLVHERLWAVKYIILIVLFGVSLQSVNMAERYAEIEPFKTAISLHFHREWWFVAYAAGLLAVSLFNRKFFCKYLCPLGAGLAVAGRFRIFEWLRRRPECGNPCQVCRNECEVRAISDTGEINLNECHYCMDCQITYWNKYKCPPLVKQRKKLERARAGQSITDTEQQIPFRPQTENGMT